MSDPTALPNFSPSTPAPANQPDTPEAPLAERVRDALAELGLEAEIDTDGDVAFEFSEQRLFVRTANDESGVLSVFGQWSLEAPVPTDPIERYEACNDVNGAFNLIKTVLGPNDTLIVSSEHILPSGADVRGLMGLAVPLVMQGVQLWHQRVTGMSLQEAVEANTAQEDQA
ncbi:YbjN domain-containing protein [Janibacter sp. GXQ6167]|uniref:YbjN domain-containing protein n=1 Tax=Janibacter sp. GXQ6167 TaxID=3240791 RepID=UPI00352678C4